uniref:uncharacterized protein LOC122610318 n=1 Tax=Erigeron canadensis TaxID=72917 RepID=UPI001CB93BC6|nr:uncharacterized protein LOC122610318 [Erigeron canadensis]
MIILDATKKDKLVWKHDNVEHPFSSSAVWNALRQRGEEVNWAHLVWFSSCIPKHAFIMWLIIREKLLTQDKILKWSPSRRLNMNVMCCSLCIAAFDSHSHLFFECKYSMQVWLRVRNDAFMQHIPPKWNDIMDWLNAREQV